MYSTNHDNGDNHGMQWNASGNENYGDADTMGYVDDEVLPSNQGHFGGSSNSNNFGQQQQRMPQHQQQSLDPLIDDDDDEDEQHDGFGNQQQLHQQQEQFSLSRQTSGAYDIRNLNQFGSAGAAGGAAGGIGSGDGASTASAPVGTSAAVPKTSSWQHHLAQGNNVPPRRNHSSDALDFMRQNDPQQHQQDDEQNDHHPALRYAVSQQNATFPHATGTAKRSASMYAGGMDGAAAAAAAAAIAIEGSQGGSVSGSIGGGGGGGVGMMRQPRRQRSVSFAPSTYPVGVGVYDQHNVPEHLAEGAGVAAAAAAAAAALDEPIGNDNQDFLSAPYQDMMQQYNQEQQHAFAAADGGGKSAGLARMGGMGNMGNMGNMGGMQGEMDHTGGDIHGSAASAGDHDTASARRSFNANMYQAKLPNPSPGIPAPPNMNIGQGPAEPPRPDAKWSRRCALPQRKSRVPDVHDGVQISSQQEMQQLHQDWQHQLQQEGHQHVIHHVVDCFRCGVPLRAAKLCTMIRCPACQEVSPAATCPVHRMR